jgi:predicted metal-binding protein
VIGINCLKVLAEMSVAFEEYLSVLPVLTAEIPMPEADPDLS